MAKSAKKPVKYFELMDHTESDSTCTVHDGKGNLITLTRIRALVDYPVNKSQPEQAAVKAGDIGGFVESVNNIKGHGWVGGDARVYGNATVMDNAVVRGKAIVRGLALVHDNAVVDNNAIIEDMATVGGEARVTGESTVKGQAKVGQKAVISSGTCITDKCIVSENATVKNSFLTGNVSLHGTVMVDNSEINGSVTVRNEAKITDATISGVDCTIAYDALVVDCTITISGKLGKGAVISNDSDVLTFIGVGSEQGTLVAYRTPQGVSVTRGCFAGTLKEFKAACKETYDKEDDDPMTDFYREQYLRIAKCIKQHFKTR